ncbi:MAG: hypothetical protein IKE38_04775 [Erysipelotrichaceae bacterium]|nr:hypothetical protein [Erysipelotrichaceae bacterium]
MIIYYFTDSKGTDALEEYSLEKLLSDPSVKYENDKITISKGYHPNDISVYEKTDEIPDIE